MGDRRTRHSRSWTRGRRHRHRHVRLPGLEPVWRSVDHAARRGQLFGTDPRRFSLHQHVQRRGRHAGGNLLLQTCVCRTASCMCRTLPGRFTAWTPRPVGAAGSTIQGPRCGGACWWQTANSTSESAVLLHRCHGRQPTEVAEQDPARATCIQHTDCRQWHPLCHLAAVPLGRGPRPLNLQCRVCRARQTATQQHRSRDRPIPWRLWLWINLAKASPASLKMWTQTNSSCCSMIWPQA